MVMSRLPGFDGDRSRADRHGDADGRAAMRLPKRGQAVDEIPKRRFSRQRKGEGAALELGDHPMLRRVDGAAVFHGFFSSISRAWRALGRSIFQWIATLYFLVRK
jgi:hypothetical protein